MHQGAVGQVRLVDRAGRTVIEKRIPNPIRHDTELLALRALAGSDLPVPELVEVAPGSMLMTLMPGERLDSADRDGRLERLRASTALLRQLHGMKAPRGLPAAPDDAHIVRRYREVAGPPLPLAIPPAGLPVICHGDWTDGNLLAVGTKITAILDWDLDQLTDELRAWPPAEEPHGP